MEETKFVEKQEILPTEKMKSASSHDKIMESVCSVSSDSDDSPILSPDEIPKREEVIPNEKQEQELKEPLEKSVEKSQEKMDSPGEKPISEAIPSLTSLEKDSKKLEEGEATREVSEAKGAPPILGKDISLESVPRESEQEHDVNETVSVNTLKMEAKPTAIQLGEPNPQENSTEKAEGPIGSSVAAAAKEETINLEQDHQMTGETSKAAAKDQIKRPKESEINAAKKQIMKEAMAMLPEEKIKKDMQEYLQEMEAKKRVSDEMDAREAEAILVEGERRKNWKSLVTEVSQATSFPTLSSSFERSPTSRAVVVAILQRCAKQRYKREMTILRENYTFRLGLLKQLKHDIKNNYRSEAQQLYFEYNSIKQKTQNTRPIDTTTDVHLDSKESKAIVTSENPKDLATLG